MLHKALRVGFYSLSLALFPALGLAATIDVTNSADSGAGSFRQAIADANTAGGTNTANWNGTGGLITLTTDLPAITSNLVLDQSGATGAVAISKRVTVNSAFLDLNGFGQSWGSLAGDSGAEIAISNNATLTVGTDNTDSVFDGIIDDGTSGSGNLVKVGTGTLTFTGTGSVATGDTTINEGTLYMANNGAIPNFPPGRLILNGGTFKMTPTYGYEQDVILNAGGGTLDINGDPLDAAYFDLSTISGAGGLTKKGGAILFLSGSNTYTGPTTITSGTVVITADASLGSTVAHSSVTLTNGASLSLGFMASPITTQRNFSLGTGGGVLDPAGGSLIINGAISGTGPLTVATSGAGASGGTLVLGGANSYSGGTTILGGSLVLGADNAAGSGAIDVFADSAFNLNGHDQTITQLTNNGTTYLRTGTLTTSGNYSGSGTLTTTLASASSYGRLHVGGAADISSTALQVALSGPFVPGSSDRFTILTAGSVTGTFASIVKPAAYNFNTIYSATDVELEASRVPYPDIPTNPDNRGLENALEQVQGNPSGDLSNVLTVLNSLIQSDFNQALERLNPKSLSSLSNLTVANAGIGGAGLGPRLSAIHAGGSQASAGSSFALYDSRTGQSIPVLAQLAYSGTDLGSLGLQKMQRQNEGGPWGFFAAGTGSFGKLDSFESTLGHQVGYDFHSAGMSVGADYRLADHWVAGGLLGYSATDTDMNDSAGTSHVDSTRLGVYGTYFRENGFYVNGYLGGALNLYDTHRHIAFGSVDRTASGTPGGQQMDTQFDLGFDYKTRGATLTPIASVAYNRAHMNSFTEEGADSLDLALDGMTFESLRTNLGARLARDLHAGSHTFTPHVTAAWQHEYLDQGNSINAQFASGGAASAFSVRTSEAGRDAAVLGAGLIVEWTRTLSLTADYSGEYARTHFYAHTFNGGFRYRF
jgi:fibronectin-binding autotransporter adhesin